MLKISSLILRGSSTSNRFCNILKVNSVSCLTTSTEAKNVDTPNLDIIDESIERSKENNRAGSLVKPQRSIVAAAFASLQTTDVNASIQTPFTDEKIAKSQTVNELLSLSAGTGVSRRHALKVVSILADWSSTGKADLSQFENDPRFIKLCKVLTRSPPTKPRPYVRSEDLSTILSVTADDEAAKLVESITLPQMIKVMSTLGLRKRRSTLLLRALSFHITAIPDKLDLKQCADILYSVAVLNYPDMNLLGRISNDICTSLNIKLDRSSVIGSIVTSLGVLRYKDPILLDALCEWIVKNQAICRPQDIFSLFMTLAVLNYTPSNAETLYKTLLPQMTQPEAGKPLVWLEVIWSLVLLNQATPKHVGTVLSEKFIETLGAISQTSQSTKLKLLNIDTAAANLLSGYEGPRLPDTSEIKKVQVVRSKEKKEMVDVLVDSLRNLIQNEKHLAVNVDSGAGFFIDAICVLDRKCNPLPIYCEESRADATKIAILALDYHDMCRNKVEPTGVNGFAMKVLESLGYKVVAVPYTEFQMRDKVVTRVKYLENKLKEAIQC